MSLRLRSQAVVLGICLLILGCGDAPGGKSSNSPTVTYKQRVAEAAPPAAPTPMPLDIAPRRGAEQAVNAQMALKGNFEKGAGVEAETPIERKIIYSATVEVTVKNLDDTRQEVERITDELKGYIAKSEVVGDTGRRRQGTWSLKIPSEKFRLATSMLAKLGVPTKNSSDSQDVTEEFIDVQARLKNLKAEEEILNKLLKDAVRLEDVLKLREQIKTIRGDIERAEGRMKYLSTMAALSTISFVAREEEEKYTPPAAPTPPTFFQSVEATFNDSLNSLQQVGVAVALFCVRLLPWTPLILLVLWLIRRCVRWMAQSWNEFWNAPVETKRSRRADQESS